MLDLDGDAPEISDVIVSFDPVTRARLPVRRAEVIARFEALGNRRAARIVAGIPERDGELDRTAVDALLLRVHAELQRLSEEFEHGRRVADLLRPVIAASRATGAAAPIRIIDVGCGTGYVARWLAAQGALGEDVEIVGVDFNSTLVGAARRMAAAEGLAVRFLVDDAFRLDEPGSIYVSTGLLHHFRGASLETFFRSQDQERCLAFLHIDFQPSIFARPGAWLFHVARMREPLSIHDGVLSAARAHAAAALIASARAGCPSFRATIVGARLGPIPRVFHTLLGARPTLVEALRLAPAWQGSRSGDFS